VNFLNALIAARARRRLDFSELRNLVMDRLAGMSCREIREKYKLPKSTLSYILNGYRPVLRALKNKEGLDIGAV
jgi:transposase